MLAATVVLSCARDSSPKRPEFRIGIAIDTARVDRWWDATGWRKPIPQILENWRLYLASTSSFDAVEKLGFSPYWATADQRDFKSYDIARGRVDAFGASATVLHLAPSSPGATDRYEIRTLFSWPHSTPGRVPHVAIVRVYATRENGRWVFSNVLSDLTRDWPREKVGPITYIMQPGHRFDRTRAERAVAFSDSLAEVFGVPAITDLEYYVTDSREEMYRIVGIDWYADYGEPGGGFAMPRDKRLFSGDVLVGEEHRHELTHVVLQSLDSSKSHWITSEGLATWFGGTLGQDAAVTLTRYAGLSPPTSGDHT